MNKKETLYILVIILSVFIIVPIACWYIFSTLKKLTPPAKPEKVPESAVWVGGYDGGCFILLRSEFSDTCRFTIYNEYTGDMWYDGYFYCNKNDYERISKMDWRELVDCYNGKYIFMKDSDDVKREIVWSKLMPINIPDPDEVYWVESDSGGWFFELRSAFEDTSHFVIYHGITGEVLHDGLFYCNKNDYEYILVTEWSNLLQGYDSVNIVMRDPNDDNRHIIWHPVL